MKQQILVIHGGDTFHSYEEYLAFLKKETVDLSSLGKHDWKATLEEELGEDYQVIAPRMPNKQNAKYLEWKIWMEKFIPFLKNEVILIGHSMGGVFLAKYLSNEKFPKNILATFLVAPPYKDEKPYSLGSFLPSKPLKAFADQGGKVFLYFSKDDPVVPFSELAEYQKELPKAEVRIFQDRGHFHQEELPEIVEDIKSL